MTNKPSKYYTLPVSTYYPKDYDPIVINFDHINRVKRKGTYLFINKVVGYLLVKYSDAFEVDLLVEDINNKWETYKQSV